MEMGNNISMANKKCVQEHIYYIQIESKKKPNIFFLTTNTTENATTHDTMQWDNHNYIILGL